MTSPDYPVLAVPGHDLFQLAQVATFIADRLHRHNAAVGSRDRTARKRAARDVHVGRSAFGALTGQPEHRGGPLPRPLDAATFDHAQRLAERATARSAHIVSLASLGRSSWAVVGHAPGLGRLGAEVPDRALAEVLAEHLRKGPRTDLTPWLVTREPLGLGLDRWGTADQETALADLDQSVARDHAVAAALLQVPPATGIVPSSSPPGAFAAADAAAAAPREGAALRSALPSTIGYPICCGLPTGGPRPTSDAVPVC